MFYLVYTMSMIAVSSKKRGCAEDVQAGDEHVSCGISWPMETMKSSNWEIRATALSRSAFNFLSFVSCAADTETVIAGEREEM